MLLTTPEIRAAAARERTYSLSDGGGLQLRVTPRGGKAWSLAYRFAGRQRRLQIGPFPQVSLSEARRVRDRARKQLWRGEDPAQVQRKEKHAARYAAGWTFGEAAEAWWSTTRPRWRAATALQKRQRLDAHLLPFLAERRLGDIEPVDVLDLVRRVERRGKIALAWAILLLARSVFRFAVGTGRLRQDPTAHLDMALRPYLHRRNFAALPAADLPLLYARLGRGRPMTELALRLLLLTFVRPQELRLATWTEFEDLEGDRPAWRIPGERMKMGRPHVVPLPPQAVRVLQQLKAGAGASPFVFPSATKSGVLGSATLYVALRRMGFAGCATPHGFRRTASTVLNEEMFNRDWIEIQLSHRPSTVRNVYNGAEWLNGRRQMMCWWADYLDAAESRGRTLSASAVDLLPSARVRRRARRPGAGRAGSARGTSPC